MVYFKKFYLFLFFCCSLFIFISCSEELTTTNKIKSCLANGDWCESIINKQVIAILLPKEIPYLQPFPVKVKLDSRSKESIKQLEIQFSMKKMKMGKNIFNLKQVEDSEYWTTKVVLPVCVSGRHDWIVNVVIKTNNLKLERHFEIELK